MFIAFFYIMLPLYQQWMNASCFLPRLNNIWMTWTRYITHIYGPLVTCIGKEEDDLWDADNLAYGPEATLSQDAPDRELALVETREDLFLLLYADL